MSRIQELERIVGRNQSIVIDNAMELTNIVEWSRAVTLVLAEEAYSLSPRSDGSLVRGASLSIPRPLVICLNRYVPKRVKAFENDTSVSKKMILTRDDYTCQYCQNYGDTVDHIYPKSRGGKNTWGNLCAACKECNGKKADNTPEEVGMKRPVIPTTYTPRITQEIQTTIYDVLSELVS